MGNIECTKCDVAGSSKCPYCQLVIVSYDAGIKYIRSVVYVEGPNEDTNNMMFISFGPLRSEIPREEHFDNLVKSLKEIVVNGKLTKQFLCQHSWVFAKGFKSEIGCGHGA